MDNSILTTMEQESGEKLRPRKANECFIDPKKFAPAEALFDEFWREGELGLFFGASGTGKSILAVQMADALARGRPIEGFAMPKGHRKTLYVDLKLSDRQFQARYSKTNERSPQTEVYGTRNPQTEVYGTKTYKFAENLYRDRPAATDGLCDWLRAMIAANGFRVVIIDDLTAVKCTHDGTRDTLALMRRLRQIKEEFNVSILVITDAETPREYVSEADLRRSRVLCSVADSVFAIGEHPEYYDQWCLIQTRSRNSPIRWDRRNAPVCKRVREDSGWLRLEFDERFAPKMDVETMRLVVQIAWHKIEGESYRSIAEAIGLSKSQVARLHKKWTPELERRVDEIEEEELDARLSEEGEEENETARWGEDEYGDAEEFCDAEMEGRGDTESEPPASAGGFLEEAGTTKQHEMTLKIQQEENPRSEITKLKSPPTNAGGSDCIPWAAGLARRTVYDLMWGEDGYGREIFIESEDEHTGKPTVWYLFDKAGHKIRHERNMFCVRTERLGASAYL